MGCKMEMEMEMDIYIHCKSAATSIQYQRFEIRKNRLFCCEVHHGASLVLRDLNIS